MAAGIFVAVGGLGLFLLGMALMTEGLEDLAGQSLRRWLARFTGNPWTGAAIGAVGTALVQSSSVTTVMAVGFVGAGLLTFPQALGIIFGANIGTTITGWLVALLGFKLKLQAIAAPFVLAGALMRLLGRRRIAAAGYALAGFGLVFAGITTLQGGMESLRDVVTPQSFPPDTLSGRALLVLVGIGITLATQSSSAGVATAITAVHVGSISLSQAAAMVIGMDIATTVKAAIAAIGGTVNARRTGFAHVIYNLLTGIAAFILLPLYVHGWNALAPDRAHSDPEIGLVAFHSLFNVLGVLVVLPFTREFAAMITWLIPARESALTRRLDVSLINNPDVAMESVRATLRDLAAVVCSAVAGLLAKTADADDSMRRVDDAERALGDTRRYLGQISTASADQRAYQRHISALHVVDHLARLIVRSRKEDPLKSARADSELAALSDELSAALTFDFVDVRQAADVRGRLEALWRKLDRRIEPFRHETIARTVAGSATTDEAIARLAAIRWLRRVCYHAWRIVFHLFPPALPSKVPVGEPEDEPEEMD